MDAIERQLLKERLIELAKTNVKAREILAIVVHAKRAYQESEIPWEKIERWLNEAYLVE